jgi:hypothetical protein
MYSNNLLLVERSTTVANQQSFAHLPGGLALKVAPLPLFTELPRRCEPVEKVAARPIGASEPGSGRPKNDAPRARTGVRERPRRNLSPGSCLLGKPTWHRWCSPRGPGRRGVRQVLRIADWTGRTKKPEPLHTRDPGHCHDVKPWTHLNRVLLCQATLSIGPYLLLKVQFQHHFCSPNLLSLNPKSWSLATPPRLSPAPILRDPGPSLPATSHQGAQALVHPLPRVISL